MPSQKLSEKKHPPHSSKAQIAIEMRTRSWDTTKAVAEIKTKTEHLCALAVGIQKIAPVGRECAKRMAPTESLSCHRAVGNSWKLPLAPQMCPWSVPKDQETCWQPRRTHTIRAMSQLPSHSRTSTVPRTGRAWELPGVLLPRWRSGPSLEVNFPPWLLADPASFPLSAGRKSSLSVKSSHPPSGPLSPATPTV